MLRGVLLVWLALLSVACDPYDGFTRAGLGEPCGNQVYCTRGPEGSTMCHEGRCVLVKGILDERERASAAESLKSSEIPEGVTLPAGWFTRVRTAKSKGVALAQCAAGEWITGGSCQLGLYNETRGVGEPVTGPDGLGKGAGWKCTANGANVAIQAFAICASARGESAEQPSAPTRTK